ncbi:hypothetical protein JCM8097_004787 [Rhodosporidiobolus ruineniae]
METLNERAGFLCNHEVLSLLRSQRDERTHHIKRLNDKKRGKDRDGSEFTARDEIERIQPQDLHTVTFEALRYLEESVHPMRRQTTDSVSKLLDQLEELDLTKAERLQLVNLMPSNTVELHVCIEEISERFPTDEEQQHLLSLIKTHLSSVEDAATAAKKEAAAQAAAREAAQRAEEARAEAMEVDEREAAAIADDEGFVDEGGRGTRANEDVENDIDEER